MPKGIFEEGVHKNRVKQRLDEAEAYEDVEQT